MTPRPVGIISFLIIGSMILAATVRAESSESKFKDPQTGEFDVSVWLESRAGFLPVPTIITEPAVGFGAGVFMSFFHPTKDSLKWERAPDGATDEAKAFIPPSM